MKHLDGSQSIRFRTSRSESDLQSASPFDPSSGGNSGPDRRLTPGESSQRKAETLQLDSRYSGATIATICTVFLLLPLTVIGLSARMNVHFGANISRQNMAVKEEVKGALESGQGQREGGEVSFAPLLLGRIFPPTFSTHVPVMLQKYKALLPYVMSPSRHVVAPINLQMNCTSPFLPSKITLNSHTT